MSAIGGEACRLRARFANASRSRQPPTGGLNKRQRTMGIFSCLSRPKTVDAVDGDNSIFIDGMDMKDGASVGGSPGRRARAAGSDSLSSSPRKQRIDYDALVKAKQMPGTALHAVATATGAPGTTGNVELANARALVRSLARKPESRQAPSRRMSRHSFLKP